MPSSDPVRVLQIIGHNIGLVRTFVAGMSYKTFQSDERTIYAVTRCLEIISEASRRLPENVKTRHPDVLWNRIAGAGNIYRHDYEDVLPGILWTTIREGLDELERAVVAELGKAEGK
jgi:uncharacterized protein with HEPN domain